MCETCHESALPHISAFEQSTRPGEACEARGHCPWKLLQKHSQLLSADLLPKMGRGWQPGGLLASMESFLINNKIAAAIGLSASSSAIRSPPAEKPARRGATTMSLYRASSGAIIASVPADVMPRNCKYRRTSWPAPAASAMAESSIPGNHGTPNSGPSPKICTTGQTCVTASHATKQAGT